MSHPAVLPTSLWSTFLLLDQQGADEVRARGCRHCAGKLHVANYSRKPRGVSRKLLGSEYLTRWSFCCAQCRKRTTPPSLRFLGRKVYLGALLVLFGNVCVDAEPSAALYASAARRTGIPARTLKRWRHWWTQTLPPTRWWRQLRSRLVPACGAERLPLVLLERVGTQRECERVTKVLALAGPLTTGTCSYLPRLIRDTQKMV